MQKPNGQNWWRSSDDSAVRVVNFGLGTDVNVNADYDGDGVTDWAKVRTQSGSRVWYLHAVERRLRGATFGHLERRRRTGRLRRRRQHRHRHLAGGHGSVVGPRVLGRPLGHTWGQIGDALPVSSYITGG